MYFFCIAVKSNRRSAIEKTEKQKRFFDSQFTAKILSKYLKNIYLIYIFPIDCICVHSFTGKLALHGIFLVTICDRLVGSETAAEVRHFKVVASFHTSKVRRPT